MRDEEGEVEQPAVTLQRLRDRFSELVGKRARLLEEVESVQKEIDGVLDDMAAIDLDACPDTMRDGEP